jgi:hypothetical protein
MKTVPVPSRWTCPLGRRKDGRCAAHACNHAGSVVHGLCRCGQSREEWTTASVRHEPTPGETHEKSASEEEDDDDEEEDEQTGQREDTRLTLIIQ